MLYKFKLYSTNTVIENFAGEKPAWTNLAATTMPIMQLIPKGDVHYENPVAPLCYYLEMIQLIAFAVLKPENLSLKKSKRLPGGVEWRQRYEKGMFAGESWG